MITKLEFEDIEPFLPLIQEELIKRMEQDKFLRYPDGLCEHLGYQRGKVYEIWISDGFPQKQKAGIRGVYLSDLKKWMG